jgi:hypothetical protein
MEYAGKIEKAKFYAAEPERVTFDEFTVRIRGDNDMEHQVTYHSGEWNCDCNFFKTRNFCSHTMAIERVLGDRVALAT